MRPTLSTPRLRLEPLRPEHAELLVELDSDPEVLQHIFGRALSREESLAAFPLRMDPDSDERGLGLWVGFQDAGFEDRPFVGWWCLLRDADPTTAEVGYRLPRSAWGRGLATEGARAMLDHGFETVGLDSVWAETRDTNLASQNVLTKSALRQVSRSADGVLRYVVTRIEWADHLLLELRKSAGWENTSGALAEAGHLAALGRELALPRLLAYRDVLDRVDLTDDAGDVADEVWRGRTAVRHGLELLGEARSD
jgi:RimJ/RimL family protein N-acetyltransferase